MNFVERVTPHAISLLLGLGTLPMVPVARSDSPPGFRVRALTRLLVEDDVERVTPHAVSLLLGTVLDRADGIGHYVQDLGLQTFTRSLVEDDVERVTHHAVSLLLGLGAVPPN